MSSFSRGVCRCMLVNTRRLRVRDLNRVQCRKAASQVGPARREKRRAGADHGSKLSDVDPQLRNLCEKFPKTFGRRTDRPENIYHVHSVAVDMLMESIGTMADLDDAVLFEANPGPGILTRCLLESGVPHLRVFEKNPLFLKELEGLKQKYPSQLEVVEEDLLRLPTLQACDSYGTTSRVDALLRGLPPQAWKEPPCLLVIASLSRKRELSFLRFLLHMLPQRASLFAIGRIDFLLFLTETEYTYLSASNSDHNFKKYRDVSILYKLFFDIEVLGKKEAKTADQVILPFIVRQQNPKWIPGCGPRLIRGGVRVFDRMGDLSPNQVLSVFRLFSSLPEYAHSPFQAAVAREMHPTHDDDHDES
ncbi:hypothetical protein HPB47_008632 [Ixodes persulcatus]|uniref:Uncharacterized protein n=1 Tax=Ixodes persulcatus TaxID=34615 RepID=A0AC60P484_IXOPE|nr:hypothetical protein HPB47_008632 [Ixodes persulcatus]